VSVSLKNHKSLRWAAGLGLLAFLVILTTCNSPMGFGPIVDTDPPQIFISTPTDNEYIRGILVGKPIIMTGICLDDVGVTSLWFEVLNRTKDIMIDPGNVTYQLTPEGNGRHSWRAELIILDPGTADYNIKVIGRDKFGNEGASDVTVRIDIIPPWVKGQQIVRHPGSGFAFTDPLHDRDYFIGIGYQMPEAYRNILNTDLDKYQNETFTLRVEIEPTFADVAASRLYVKDENDVALNAELLVPTRYTEPGAVEQRYPEWDISAADLLAWRPSFSAGARYIFFEIWAWSESAWDANNNKPYPDEPGRVQKIDGAIWYPESDYPHIYIDPENILNDILTLPPDVPSALIVKFYDDDRLGSIYTKLITKKEFDDLRNGVSEEEFLNSLTDTADPDGKRAALITALGMQNSFDPQPNVDNRSKDVILATTGLAQGEYRLIALAKDDKSGNGYSFTDGEKWSVYPPVMVQIQNAQAPLVLIENPERENIFPNLSTGGGERFTMSGRTLGQSGTHTVEIAWVPKALQDNGLTEAMAVLNSNEVETLAVNDSLTAANGIKVWKLDPGEPEKTVINGRDYFETRFNHVFHIVNDFQFDKGLGNGDELENDDKLFVIHAINLGGADAFKTFNLSGLVTGPTIEGLSHTMGAGHDPHVDLDLRMRVRPGNYGVAVAPNSQRITDITENLAGDDASFVGQPTSLIAGGEWQRIATSQYILDHYPEGTVRTYAFMARDILGNETQLKRDITLSTRPLLEFISCANGPNTYGIGEELRFEASFSLPVRVTPNVNNYPMLKLFLPDAPGGPRTVLADYDRNTPSGNTLLFTYTVQEGDTTALLHTPLDAIDDNSALITSYKGYTEADKAQIVFLNDDNCLEKTTAVALDATRPRIDRASFAPVTGYTYDGQNLATQGITYFNNGRTVTLKLITDEKVMVSGNPAAVLRCDGRQLIAQFASKGPNPDDVNGEILTFTYTVSDILGGVSAPINLKQLEWGAPWFGALNETNDITDMVGNRIVITGYDASLSNANRRGEAVGTTYTSEQGYIKTYIPAAPSYTLNGTGGTDSLLTNANVQLSITGGETPLNGVGGAILYYSLRGGSAPQSTAGTETITEDSSNTDKYSPNYERSQYNVTAWQIDFAGNRSPQAALRPVTINSRWPELRSMDMSVPDGSYPAGTAITFRMNFSGMVEPQTGASVTLNIAGASPPPQNATQTATVAVTGALAAGTLRTEGNGYSTQLSVDWIVPGNIAQTMKNIKAQSIVFAPNGVKDEYGNYLGTYSGTVDEDDPSNTNRYRPINNTSTFNLTRPNVEIRSARPRVTSASPDLPTVSGEGFNGGIITAGSGKTFTLTFDVPVTKVAGKYITVRPYGNWAIPPVLSPEDYLALYNATTSDEYKKRLSNIDVNGVPLRGSERGNAYAYNSYLETTHGVTDMQGYVRPDITAKRVLAFDIDPYETAITAETPNDRTALLREVFNAAGWKQERISIGSGQVVLNNNEVTVTLNNALLPGRIWEVLLDDGAFRDLAGNPSVPITAAFDDNGNANNDNNTKYRFWSAGTETPVIRVDRITYDGDSRDNARRPVNKLLGFIDDNNDQKIPPIDTKVRIDCETPGATIRYDVIRTRFLPAAANGTAVPVASTVTGSTININLNPVFGGTDSTPTDYSSDLAFFGDVQINAAGTTGYTRNNIGNADRNNAANKTNGFLNNLLVPNEIQTGSGSLDNGAVLMTNMTGDPATYPAALQNSLRSGTNLSSAGRAYRTIGSNGNATFNNNFIFIGDAYNATAAYVYNDNDNKVAEHTSRFLYSGRRDYIAAAAQKGSVTTAGNFAGPVLNVSVADSMEGVYKTTMLYRNPRTNGVTQVVLDGRADVIYDNRLIPGFGVDNNPSGIDVRETNAYKTFYRVGVNASTTGTVTAGDATNNHILVTWEIVADFRSRPVFYRNDGPVWSQATGTSNEGGFIAATYGAVVYRYRDGSY